MVARSVRELRPGIAVPVFSQAVAFDGRDRRGHAAPSPRRGADTSLVDGQNFVPLRAKVSPHLLARLDRAAAMRGVSRAEMLRVLISSMEGGE